MMRGSIWKYNVEAATLRHVEAGETHPVAVAHTHTHTLAHLKR